MESMIQKFRNIRFEIGKNEVWRDVDFGDQLVDDLMPTTQADYRTSECNCNIPDLQANRAVMINGIDDDRLTCEESGLIYGSLRQAEKEYPQWVKPYLGKCFDAQEGEYANRYEQFNRQHYRYGFFVYVPDEMTIEKPIQLQSITHSEKPLFCQTRTLIILGKRSKATVIQCDDSVGESRGMSNNVTEIYMSEGSWLRHYKLQNMNDHSGLLNHTYCKLEGVADLRSVAMDLNGGHIRNHTEVVMTQEDAHTEVHGLYLIDKEQEADNYVFVKHGAPRCYSHELFKGILDDSARGTFNGHVLVDEGAIKTEAYQSNKNILLTDKATVVSKPFLEIYNDDVKCSHGSSTGQIDEQQMFYICSRGITPRTAQTMLLYAYCDEVIQKIELTELRNALSDMVKKRLHGELTVCSDCSLNCGTPCNGAQPFEIDLSKL